MNAANTLTSLTAVSVAAASGPTLRTTGAMVALEVEAGVSAPLFSKQRFDFLTGSPRSWCTEQLVLVCPEPSLAVSAARFRFLSRKALLDKLPSTDDNKSAVKKLIWCSVKLREHMRAYRVQLYVGLKFQTPHYAIFM